MTTSMSAFLGYCLNGSVENSILLPPCTKQSLSGNGDFFHSEINEILRKDNYYKTYPSRKKFILGETCNDTGVDIGEGWPAKAIVEWSQEDTINWLMSAALHTGQKYCSIQHSLAIPGKDLILLTKQDFHNRDSVYGHRLYEILHSPKLFNLRPHFSSIYLQDEEKEVNSSNFSVADSKNHEDTSNKSHDSQRKKFQKHPRREKLWEFIRDLLLNRETCPSLICWEDYSLAKFRFVQSAEIAKRWGARNGNTKMTFDKFSRALRYYYDSEIFLPTHGRLIYRFGPNAKGWQTDNPNFNN